MGDRVRLGARVRPFGAVVLFCAAVAVQIAYRIRTAPTSVDLAVYRAAGAAARAGRDVYGPLHLPDHLRSTYPPFSALVFAPLSEVGVGTAVRWVFVVNVALVLLAGWFTCRVVDVPAPQRRTAALIVAAAALFAEPVVATLNLGQIDLLVMVLVLRDLAQPPGARSRGVGIGIATGLKLTPALFVVYLLVTRRYRDAGTALATFAATALAGWLFLPDASRRYWTALVFQLHRVGRVSRYDNQSVRGLLARFMHQADAGVLGVVVAVVVVGVGLWLAGRAYLVLGEAWGAMTCAVTTLLVSPISWTHHWVWCVPVAALLVRRAPAAAPFALVFWSWVVLLLPYGNRHPTTLHGAALLLASGVYVYFGVGFLALVAVRVLRVSTPGSMHILRDGRNRGS